MNINLNRKLRIVLVLLAQGVLIYGHFNGHSIFTILLFAGLLATFLFLSHQGSKLLRQVKIAEANAILEQRNAARRSGKWVKFESDGAEYISSDHKFSRDLDLFGHASLFQYLNDTNTAYGNDILKRLLLTEKRDQGAVLRRQAAVKEISENSGFCRSLKSQGILSSNISQSPAEMVAFFESDSSLFEKPFAMYALRILPVVSALAVASNFIVGFNNALLICTGIVLITQALVFVSLSNKTEAVLKELSKFRGSLDDFGVMASLIKEARFSAELNMSWQNKLPERWALKKITWALNVRNITLLDLLLNILFLWDIHCVCTLEKMRAKGAKDIRTWLEAIGYFEAMSSVAVLPQLSPSWAYPEICEELSIQAKELGHPLINEQDRITNDFELSGIAIISGSNMSGKTTFLRTIGINLVLAYMGAPVCATSFRAPPLDIWTCMRPPDNLSQNISTFYAELLRIKRIVEGEETMLFLIDEIFAGTNSEDRVEGAVQVLYNLSKKQTLGLITTHDLEVCKAEGFANHHFS